MPHCTLNSLWGCWRSTAIAAWGSISVEIEGKCLYCSLVCNALGKCQLAVDKGWAGNGVVSEENTRQQFPRLFRENHYPSAFLRKQTQRTRAVNNHIGLKSRLTHTLEAWKSECSLAFQWSPKLWPGWFACSPAEQESGTWVWVCSVKVHVCDVVMDFCLGESQAMEIELSGFDFQSAVRTG